jgi:hypothetical protein
LYEHRPSLGNAVPRDALGTLCSWDLSVALVTFDFHNWMCSAPIRVFRTSSIHKAGSLTISSERLLAKRRQ